MTLGEYTLSFPIWVEFGTGTSDRTGEVITSQGWESALIVTDEGIREVGILDGVESSLDAAGVAYDVFDGVEPNPTVEMVSETVEELTTGGHDVVVAVGGGSVIDTAKCATLMTTNSGDLTDYEVSTPDDVTAGTVENHTHPLVTIPTTAGTGSEVDYWAVITSEERRFKMAIGQPPLYPGGPYLGADISLVDPELTASLRREILIKDNLGARTPLFGSYLTDHLKNRFLGGGVRIVPEPSSHLRDWRLASDLVRETGPISEVRKSVADRLACPVTRRRAGGGKQVAIV